MIMEGCNKTRDINNEGIVDENKALSLVDIPSISSWGGGPENEINNFI